MLTNWLAACAHLTITVSETERDISEKIVILSYPLHSTPPLGMEKLEWWGYQMMKNIEDIYNGLNTIPACDRRTDILPRHIRAMHTRRAVKARPLRLM